MVAFAPAADTVHAPLQSFNLFDNFAALAPGTHHGGDPLALVLSGTKNAQMLLH